MAYALHLYVAGETVTAANLNQSTYYNDSFLGGADGYSGTVGVGPIDQASATDDVNTASASLVDLANMTLTLTTKGGDLYVWFTATVTNAGGGVNNNFAVVIDSEAAVQIGVMFDAYGIAGQHVFTGVAAGSHTVKIQYSCSAGAIHATYRQLTVMEVRA